MSAGARVLEVLGLDAALNNSKRLAILTALEGPFATEGLTHSQAREVTGLTAGNLGAYVRVLEEIGYLTSRKEFVNKRPRTSYRITPEGRRALEAHYHALTRLRIELGLRVRDLESSMDPHETAHRDGGECIGEALP